MEARDAVWRWSVRATGVVGLGCAVAAWGWQVPLIAVLVVGTIVGIIPWCLETGVPVLRTGCRVGVRAGVAVPAAGGLVAECGAWGVMLLLILVAGWPRWRFRSGGPRTSPVVMPDPTPSDPELVLDPGTLDDESLCRAWRTSFWRLQEARGAEALGLVVRQRQRFLDELASRHPAEVDRWLRSGPRAASNPWPFLQPTPPTH